MYLNPSQSISIYLNLSIFLSIYVPIYLSIHIYLYIYTIYISVRNIYISVCDKPWTGKFNFRVLNSAHHLYTLSLVKSHPPDLTLKRQGWLRSQSQRHLLRQHLCHPHLDPRRISSLKPLHQSTSLLSAELSKTGMESKPQITSEWVTCWRAHVCSESAHVFCRFRPPAGQPNHGSRRWKQDLTLSNTAAGLAPVLLRSSELPSLRLCDCEASSARVEWLCRPSARCIVFGDTNMAPSSTDAMQNQVSIALRPSTMGFWHQHPHRKKSRYRPKSKEIIQNVFPRQAHRSYACNEWEPVLVTLLPHLKADHIASLPTWLRGTWLQKKGWLSHSALLVCRFSSKGRKNANISFSGIGSHTSHTSRQPLTVSGWHLHRCSQAATHLGHVVPSRRPSKVTLISASPLLLPKLLCFHKESRGPDIIDIWYRWYR